MYNRGYSIVALHQPKNAFNVGGIMRAATCFDVSLIVTSGDRVSFSSDTTKTWRHTPVIRRVKSVLDYIPYDCIPIAVELTDDAESIFDFQHPQRAFYVFGPEDGTLPKEITKKCKHTLYIPTNHCMNLANTVHVTLYDRLLKQNRTVEQ